MAWEKQTKFKSGKKVDDEIAAVKEDPYYISKFLEDWEACRDRHPGQKLVLDAIFVDKLQYVFYRAGRKGAKTTTGIDAAWRAANSGENRVVYLCYPTIAAGIDIVWDERRLQTCDLKNDSMFEKYVEKVDDNKHIVRFVNGSFIKLIGTWTEARGRGRQPDFLVYDEFQDCNESYIEASDSDLAAKPHAQVIYMGTPPPKRNHYELWWERIVNVPRRKGFHLTSYDNTRLPHLKEWLDNKKIELIKAGKEDVWLREYMAEFCYSSSDRVLPDINFLENDEIDLKARQFAFADRIPLLAVTIHPTYFCACLGVLERGYGLFIMDHLVCEQVWDKSFSSIHPELAEKLKYLKDFCGKRMRNIVWDESDSFCDVITGFTKCRKDIKWQDRGIPLLRELILKEKIFFSREVADFGLECQNMLIEETPKEVQKNYPHICTLAMLVNEYFSQEKTKIHIEPEFDKYKAFRDMGIPYTPKRKGRTFFPII